jgi:hypothetical protein
MSDKSLRSHEQDAEFARAKLAGSLAILRSPVTISSFTDDLKQEALEAKDNLVDQAKSAAQSKVNELVEDLKARAAANPAAVLTIGAGLAWHAIRNPPIASALVGLGIFSLWRTNASRPFGSYRPDYLEEGKQRLKEQAGEAVAKVREMAGQGQAASQGQAMVSAQVAELKEAARTRPRQQSNDIQDAFGELKSTLDANPPLETDAPSIAPTDDRIRAIDRKAADRTGRWLGGTASTPQGTLSDEEARNKLLLGVAGLAVATALGIACQKRLAEAEKVTQEHRDRVPTSI